MASNTSLCTYVHGLNKAMAFGSPLALKTGNGIESEVPGETGKVISKGLRMLNNWGYERVGLE